MKYGQGLSVLWWMRQFISGQCPLYLKSVVNVYKEYSVFSAQKGKLLSAYQGGALELRHCTKLWAAGRSSTPEGGVCVWVCSHFHKCLHRTKAPAAGSSGTHKGRGKQTPHNCECPYCSKLQEAGRSVRWQWGAQGGGGGRVSYLTLLLSPSRLIGRWQVPIILLQLQDLSWNWVLALRLNFRKWDWKDWVHS